MASSSSGSATNLLNEITNAELGLIKTPLLAFAAALQQPGANILTVQNAGASFLLSTAALSPAAQGAALNIVGAGLTAKINSLPSS